MRKVCVVTGSRAEYGLMQRLMHMLQDSPLVDMQLVVTNMHLSPKYGETYKEIEADGFTISKKVIENGEHHRTSLLTLDEEEGIHMEYEIHDTAMHNYVETRSLIKEGSNAELAADHIKGINMAMDMLQNRS